MPKYLWKVAYSVEGAKGLLKDGGTGRRAAIEAAVQGLGGSVESFYYAFGSDDAYLIGDMPDQTAVASMSLNVAAAGGARIETIELLTPEQIDEAAKGPVEYTPPGA